MNSLTSDKQNEEMMKFVEQPWSPGGGHLWHSQFSTKIGEAF